MASSAAKWREEQILIICPGSQTTMAQLGCGELTPPTHRIPTRMFRDGDEWRPYRTFKRKRVVDGEERDEWVEDVDSDEGAVFPLEGGRIVDMEAFLAFLDHVHGLLTTTYHNTPVMLMASPQWTRPDCEAIAQYVFEKTKTPALCLIHSGIATQFGLKWPSMTVVDIGFEKVDVTAIHDGRVVNHMNLGSPNPDRRISGGEVFTQALLRLLRDKGFDRAMAEQLKRSAICEVLSYAPAEKTLAELPREDAAGPHVSGHSSPADVAARDDNDDENDDDDDDDDVHKNHDSANGNGDGNGVANGGGEEEDGVLDVAAIVSSGQTKEFLAKKEKEKANKSSRKSKDKDGGDGTKALRLPNCKRTYNTFVFEEVVQEKEDKAAAAAVVEEGASAPAQAVSTTTTAEGGEAEQNGHQQPRVKRVRRDFEVGLERFTFADRDELDRIVMTIYRTIQGIDDMYMRPACWDNLVFVGNGSRLRGLKENIMQTLHARHMVSPSTATMFTSELPSNMATPSGTGSQTPTGSFTGMPAGNNHQLSSSGGGGVNPLLQAATAASTLAAAASGAAGLSSAAAVGTPPPPPPPPSSSSAAAAAAAASSSSSSQPVVSDMVGGGQQPQQQHLQHLQHLQHIQQQQQQQQQQHHHQHHFHSQTPTSIKAANLPTYLTEWTKNGFEESMFLGAQVAARIAFCLHSNLDAHAVESQRIMSLSRVDYKLTDVKALYISELGPKAIRTHSMLS
ncbi:hypothetical protein L249_4079 [Ophiocordyceps polyrhachis-furcata BCC 54312]|uniref:Actin-like protein ARP9 n=1 Tax=Ophiocordyceps polyrhachis-furcata BCC 54312 TaxID=1330021 RepID=A0A367L692_9HYPO|nr:hypothetical protein L249_4079 [Ophiocordyceps polyrhachis-furcata BCC 54312]